MFNLLAIFLEFLVRNDNQDKIGDVVNVKFVPKSYSTLSISLADLD